MRRILSAAAITAVSLAPMVTPASASTLGVNLSATGTVIAGCTALTQTTALAFGVSLAPGTTPGATGGLSTTCATGVLSTLTFAATASTASTSTESLALTATPADTLDFGIYADSGFATGIGSGGIVVTGTGAAKATPIYGKFLAAIPADTPTGAYTSTIAVVLTF